MEAITSFPIEVWLGVGAIVWGLVSSRVAMPASIKSAIDAICRQAITTHSWLAKQAEEEILSQQCRDQYED